MYPKRVASVSAVPSRVLAAVGRVNRERGARYT